jgi:hypothetical protein
MIPHDTQHFFMVSSIHVSYSIGALVHIKISRNGMVFPAPKRGKVKMGGLRGGGEERWEKIGIAPPSSNLVRILFY